MLPFWLMALMFGCGREPPEPYVPAAPWEQAADAAAGPAAVPPDAGVPVAEPLRGVMREGEATLTVTLDGRQLSFVMPLELGVLRSVHLETLDNAQGYVKGDVSGLAPAPGGAAGQDLAAAIIEHVLTGRDGLMQTFFELDNLDHLSGPLVDGATVSTVAIGGLQVGDRRDTIAVKLAFTRTRDDIEVRTAEPVQLDLSAFRRAEALSRVPGVRRAASSVEVSLRAVFVEAGQAPLPDFLRTAVMVRTVNEVREDHRSLTDRFQTARESAEARGTSEKLYDGIDRATFQDIQQESERRAKQRSREAQRNAP